MVQIGLVDARYERLEPNSSFATLTRTTVLAGMECYKTHRFAEAFEHYTEAIRLAPSRAVYHGNRAAAALKLGRYTMAAQDGYTLLHPRCE
eukprot:3405539-Pyramimonas_sp.AAC.1